ncbi:hypothetical protein OUZ56_012658 [Daphnia magna]|uniref:Uncharacterized protein n=1 Tax=Daphnia magna TaxID=35525 RepID=A0ABQ9Z3P9_9CRUS|nr:hypothetical protein OUZ56_012658 [Daphnia magna]
MCVSSLTYFMVPFDSASANFNASFSVSKLAILFQLCKCILQSSFRILWSSQGWYRFMLILGNSVFSTSNYVGAGMLSKANSGLNTNRDMVISVYCRGYLRPHGLVVTSGASVSAIDRNSTRDVRQSCQQIFLPVAAVYVSA